MIQSVSTTLLIAALLGSVPRLQAGEPAHTAVDKNPPPPPIEPAAAPFSGSVALGYSSEYFCRGMEMGENLVWGSLGVRIPLADKLSLELGAWYGSLADDNSDFKELDGTASLLYVAGPATLGLNFKWYHYFDHGMDMDMGMDHDMGMMHDDMGMDMGHDMMMGGHDMGMMSMSDNMYDLGPSIAVDLKFVTLTAQWAHEFQDGGDYYEVGLRSEIRLCEQARLLPSVLVGYNDEWMIMDSGWSHVGLHLGLPIDITKTLTLTPFIGANFPLDALDDHQDNMVYGGASVSVTF